MSSLNPFRKTVGFYEVMATSLPPTQACDPANCKGPSMDRASYTPITQTTVIGSTQGNNPPRNHVNFEFQGKREADKEKKAKYLTAKYGQHQMMLIRKRLGVEDWVYDNLRDLYDCKDDEDDHDCKLELEDILNYDTDSEKRQYAFEQLKNVNKPQEVLNTFVEELLRRANTL